MTHPKPFFPYQNMTGLVTQKRKQSSVSSRDSKRSRMHSSISDGEGGVGGSGALTPSDVDDDMDMQDTTTRRGGEHADSSLSASSAALLLYPDALGLLDSDDDEDWEPSCASRGGNSRRARAAKKEDA